LNLANGANTVDLTGAEGVGISTIIGGNGADAIDASSYSVTSVYIDGGLGVDALTGGDGNDTFIVDHVGDTVAEDSSAGADIVFSSVTYTIADADLEAITLTGSSVIDATGNSSANTITGNSVNNSLWGGDGNDTISGAAGNDTLLGENNDDLLDGGTGIDSLVGGTGNDTYVVDSASDIIYEAASEGNDVVYSSVNYALLSSNIENLILTGSAISGTGDNGANTITGNSEANTLSGSGGNDTLLGDAGADTLLGGSGDDSLAGQNGIDSLVGGAGSDTYYISDSSDVIYETSGVPQGTDLVMTSVNYTLANNVENIQLLGASITGTGNSLGNSLTSGNFANTLVGSTGNDTYIVSNVGVVITELSSEGTDVIQSSVSFTLALNVETLVLTGVSVIDGTGNAAANSLLGNAQDNILNGNGSIGIDTLTGGGGADTFVVGDSSVNFYNDTDSLLITDFVVGTDVLRLNSSSNSVGGYSLYTDNLAADEAWIVGNVDGIGVARLTGIIGARADILNNAQLV
jgi:hypothetical protein